MNEVSRKLLVRDHNGKCYLPAEDIGRYAVDDGLIGRLIRMGLLKVKKQNSGKMLMPTDLLSGRKFGRIILVSRREDFADPEKEIVEAKPVFGLSLEAVRKLVQLGSVIQVGSVNNERPGDRANVEE